MQPSSAAHSMHPSSMSTQLLGSCCPSNVPASSDPVPAAKVLLPVSTWLVVMSFVPSNVPPLAMPASKMGTQTAVIIVFCWKPSDAVVKTGLLALFQTMGKVGTL